MNSSHVMSPAHAHCTVSLFNSLTLSVHIDDRRRQTGKCMGVASPPLLFALAVATSITTRPAIKTWNSDGGCLLHALDPKYAGDKETRLRRLPRRTGSSQTAMDSLRGGAEPGPDADWLPLVSFSSMSEVMVTPRNPQANTSTGAHVGSEHPRTRIDTTFSMRHTE